MAVALGIDLGTTNSVAAIATPTGVEFILGDFHLFKPIIVYKTGLFYPAAFVVSQCA